MTPLGARRPLAGRDARGFPLSSFHVLLFSPSLRFDSEWFRAQASVQLFDANTNTNTTKDQTIQGYNVRGGAELTVLKDLLWKNQASVFANFSRIENDVVEPTDLSSLQSERYEAITATGGVNLNLWGPSGIGAEYAMVREVEPGRPANYRHYVNAGATWWLTDTTSIGARFALLQRCEDDNCDLDGRRGAYITLRTILGAPAQDRP